MNRGKKFVTACCITTGIGIIFCLTGYAMGARVTGVSLGTGGVSVYTLQEETKLKTERETLPEFKSVKIEIGSADVFLQQAQEYAIAYQLDDRNQLSYEVKDGTLVIRETTGKTSEILRIGYVTGALSEKVGKRYIMVQLPKECDMAQVSIDNAYGNVSFEGIAAEKVDLDLDSGDFLGTSITADKISVESAYGDIALEEARTGEIELKAASGNISLTEVSADRAEVRSEYGDVQGKAISAENLFGELSCGDCSLEDLDAKNVSLKSEYGEVELKLQRTLADYGYQLQTEYGEIRLDGRNMGNAYQSLEDKKNQVHIYCGDGDIEIRSAE